MALTPNIVRYACSGLQTTPDGRIARRNRVFAKVSRTEVARHFMSPPPGGLLDALVQRGELTRTEAGLAAHLPLAEDITVEADSGGHTDNRPLAVLLPIMAQLRDELCARNAWPSDIRLGAAGGIGSPAGVAAAFALGAAYVLTGSINQATVESGLSADARAMLAQADMADVTMAPAADMFELGVRLQVLKRGTMFAPRASTLHDVYSSYDSIAALPIDVRERLEHEIFRQPLDDVWAATRAFFETRNPREVERAEREPRHKLALVCRWYLGQSSQWAIAGDHSRRLDYQVWCGPAMGAFNRWVKDSWLEPVEQRSVGQLGLNLLEGAAVIARAQALRAHGVPLPTSAFAFTPRRLQ